MIHDYRPNAIPFRVAVSEQFNCSVVVDMYLACGRMTYSELLDSTSVFCSHKELRRREALER